MAGKSQMFLSELIHGFIVVINLNQMQVFWQQ